MDDEPDPYGLWIRIRKPDRPTVILGLTWIDPPSDDMLPDIAKGLTVSGLGIAENMAGRDE